MKDMPWIAGPKELLQHGLDHLRRESDFDTRIAMISIDNAVELMMKVYLGLPKKVTGNSMSKAKYDEVVKNFSQLLEVMQEYAPEKMADIDISIVEWFHRLRNELYHQGNGITVEKNKVKKYADLAKKLMYNLFEVSEDDWFQNKGISHEKAVSLIYDLEELSSELREFWLRVQYQERNSEDKMWHAFEGYAEEGLITKYALREYLKLRELRRTLISNISDIQRLSNSEIEEAGEQLSYVWDAFERAFNSIEGTDNE